MDDPKWPLIPSTPANTGARLVEEYEICGIVGRISIFEAPEPATGFVAVALDHGNAVSGICDSWFEARRRIEALVSGHELTESPDGQASTAEMAYARVWTRMERAVLGSEPYGLVEAAFAAGIHTATWWRASRRLAGLAERFGWDEVIGPES